VSLAFVDALALAEVLEVEEKRGMVKLVGDNMGNFCSWIRINRREWRKVWLVWA
jgi:hypothetical protein